MPGIFNLENVAILVKQVHPSRILILDTNIIMNSPEPMSGMYKGKTKSFCTLRYINSELEFIREKRW